MKRVEVVDLNGMADKDWLFKLKDEINDIYFIMESSFYKKHKLKFPITKQHIDAFLPGVIVNIDSKEINGMKIIVAVYGYFINT